MNQLTRLLCFLALNSIFSSVFATHERAGEIIYRHVAGLTYEIDIITFTYAPSPADRCELEIDFGDGITAIIERVNGGYSPDCECEHCGEIVAEDVRYNVYSTTHTYPAAGEYTISFEDPNRNGGIINIPNSINVPLYVESKLVINPFIGPNSSPQLLNPPIDYACVNQYFFHNPAAYDPDGDSLSYKLVNCRGEDGLEIVGYTLPNASNSFTIDSYTGTVTWDKPIMQGEYNIAILIQEWRNGALIGSVMRDMQIFVNACANQAPLLTMNRDFCTRVNELNEFVVRADDLDMDNILITAIGGPMLLTQNPAQLIEEDAGAGYAEYLFSWTPDCNNVQYAPHNVYFKATDDNEPINLVDFEVANILVIAHPPDTLMAQPQGNEILLTWTQSECPNAKGYRIYRSIDTTGYRPDSCDRGVPPDLGYSLIQTINSISTTTFADNKNGQGLIHGIRYSYIVTCYFNDGSESYASNEAYATLVRDVPIITNVSIGITDSLAGVDTIRWIKPLEQYLTQFLPPFSYQVFRKNLNNNAFQQIGSTNDLNDTVYIDRNLNTAHQKLVYRIDLFDANSQMVGSTHYATSIFPLAQGSDNTITLSWNNDMPWANEMWDIYRKKVSENSFTFLATVADTFFMDTGLNNGINNIFCYFVVSHGRYTAENLPQNIRNHSNTVCAYPIDTKSPNAPILQVRTNCETIENTLIWANPNHTDHETNDVVGYEIYYTPFVNSSYSLIADVAGANDTSFIHTDLQSISACYYVTAIDSFDNRSLPSNIVCLDMDSCDLYRLPNVFTPNFDGFNDFFTPFPYDYVEKIHIEIHNRWGELVFKTDDPDINWDGKCEKSNTDCSEGVYFYICEVHELRLSGLRKRILKGAVHLYR